MGRRWSLARGRPTFTPSITWQPAHGSRCGLGWPMALLESRPQASWIVPESHAACQMPVSIPTSWLASMILSRSVNESVSAPSWWGAGEERLRSHFGAEMSLGRITSPQLPDPGIRWRMSNAARFPIWNCLTSTDSPSSSLVFALALEAQVGQTQSNVSLPSSLVEVS